MQWLCMKCFFRETHREALDKLSFAGSQSISRYNQFGGWLSEKISAMFPLQKETGMRTQTIHNKIHWLQFSGIYSVTDYSESTIILEAIVWDQTTEEATELVLQNKDTISNYLVQTDILKPKVVHFGLPQFYT